MRILVAALAVAFCLGSAGVTRASSFEDSHADCRYPETFDLMIMRPLGLASMGVGMVLFVPFGELPDRRRPALGGSSGPRLTRLRPASRPRKGIRDEARSAWAPSRMEGRHREVRGTLRTWTSD